MKRIILFTLTLLLVVAIAGVVVYAVGIEKNENQPVSAFEDKNEPAPVGADDEKAENKSEKIDPADEEEPRLAPAGPAEILLEDYWAALKAERGDEPFELLEIYIKCAELFKTKQKIEFRNSFFVNAFCNYNKVVIECDENNCYINTDPDNVSETDVYMVFIAALDNCFSQDIYYKDYNYSPDMNRGISKTLWFSTEYRALGYETYTDYMQALGKKECSVYLDVKMVSFCKPDICLFAENYADMKCYESYKSALQDTGADLK